MYGETFLNLTEKIAVIEWEAEATQFKVLGNRKRNNNANMPCKLKLYALYIDPKQISLILNSNLICLLWYCPSSKLSLTSQK